MLKSYSFMPKEISADFYYRVWQEIQGLKWYFYKFAGSNADEAMQRTLMHTLTHFQPDGNLSAYVKKLAREITKDNNRLVFVDFLEQTLSDDEEATEQGGTLDTGRVQDFSVEVIDKIERSVDRTPEVAQLALSFLDKFLFLCEALKNHDTTTSYYPEPFIKECLKISKKCDNFNEICLDLYMEYGDDFKWFLGLDEGNIGTWKETDYLWINQYKSKRVRLIDKETGEEVEDADLQDWYVHGNLGEGEDQKRILKVPYEDVWEMMCDLIDSDETNEMKFIIDDNYIIRTLGGSYSIVNPDLYTYYDNVRMEILTNLLHDTYCRVLNVGSKCIYLLYNKAYPIKSTKRVIKGIPIEFDIIDITDTVI